MDSRGLEFWRTVWGNILAGLAVLVITAAASWVFGFHHQARLVIVAVTNWLWKVLMYPVSVPGVLLVIFAGFVLYAWWRAVLRKREVLAEQVMASKVHSAEARATVNAESAPLTDNEMAILRLLARADGKWVGIMELARRAALANLITEQAIDRLRDRGFLKHSVGMGTSSYRLSPAGRDYAIARGYVPPPPTVAERRALR